MGPTKDEEADTQGVGLGGRGAVGKDNNAICKADFAVCWFFKARFTRDFFFLIK